MYQVAQIPTYTWKIVIGGGSSAITFMMGGKVPNRLNRLMYKLILGNHDKGAAAMKRAGFDVVLYMASIVIAGETVTMTHCPLRGVWREDTSW